MKFSVAVVIVAVCVCLIEAKNIRTKRSVSKNNWRNELTRDLEGLEAYLKQRQQQTTEEDEEHVCEKEITDDIRRKVQNRSTELKEAVQGFLHEVNNTIFVFTYYIHHSNWTAGEISTGTMLWCVGQAARTQRGAEYVGRLTGVTFRMVLLARRDPDLADLVINYFKRKISKKFPDDAPDCDTSSRESYKKRESRGYKSYSNDTFVNATVHAICEYAKANWQDMQTDMDAVLNDGIETIKNITQFLRLMQFLIVDTADGTWIHGYLKLVCMLAYYDVKGPPTAFNEMLKSGKEIMSKFEGLLTAFDNYYGHVYTTPPPTTTPGKRTFQAGDQRVFRGLTMLKNVLKDHNLLNKKK